MRSAASLFVVVGCLGIASSAAAKGRPTPVPCPTDVLAAVAEMCPCAGKMLPNDSVQPWRNHGQYVSCVVRFRNVLRRSGCFSDDSLRRTLARCAARATCGKTDVVLCCHYDLGTCSDPNPADQVVAGTCSNGGAPCNAAADCTMSSSRIAHDATACMSDGGVVVEGGGSVCTPCPPPPSTTTTTTTLP